MLPSAFARRTLAAAGAAALAAGAFACSDDGTSPQAGPRRVYGAPVALGAGQARSYVVLDAARGDAPTEFGVALTEGAMENLPAPMHMPPGGDPHAHVDMHEYLLPLPAENPTAYKLVELDWNPAGHEAPGVYDVPHFDFHFYTVTKAERDAIDPAAGQAAFMAKSASLPPAAQAPASYVALSAPGTPVTAVPRMGVHWVDVRSSELQGLLGRPELAKPFTATFIHGSWDGKFIFQEPMVTRAFIMGRKAATAAAARDSVMPLPAAQAYAPGYHPAAYRVTYDAAAKEYRVALTQLTRHD